MSAVFYYYPDGGFMRSITLPGAFSTLVEKPVRRQVSAEAASGKRTVTTWTALTQFRVRYELLRDQTVIRQLEDLVNHLQSGGVCSMAEEGAATFAGFADPKPVRGDTSLTIGTNLFADYDTPDLTTGGEIVIQSPTPVYLRERCLLTSRSGLTVSLSTGLRHDFSDQPWAFVRDRRFWPYVRLQQGSVNTDLLTTDRRLFYTLDLPLEERPNGYESAADHASTPYAGPAPAGSSPFDIQGATSMTMPFGGGGTKAGPKYGPGGGIIS